MYPEVGHRILGVEKKSAIPHELGNNPSAVKLGGELCVFDDEPKLLKIDGTQAKVAGRVFGQLENVSIKPPVPDLFLDVEGTLAHVEFPRRHAAVAAHHVRTGEMQAVLVADKDKMRSISKMRSIKKIKNKKRKERERKRSKKRRGKGKKDKWERREEA